METWAWLGIAALLAVAFGATLLRPRTRAVARSGPSVGPERWVGREGVVLEAIPPAGGGTGVVRLEREEWRASTTDLDPIGDGERVVVTHAEPSRLVVRRV